ncbi:MAG: L-aspartate oxidase [Planctomycetes bacterium]|nr:L-aspartate oxidase [Planctomycetota bacterium]
MHELFDQRRYLIPFRSKLLPHVFTDVLVIGSGVAGMRAAIEAARHGDVILLSKDDLDLSCTAAAQGGIASAQREDDSAQAHGDDTISVGAGLCAADAVKVLVTEGPERIEELLEWGMRFDRDEGGALSLGREGGHRANRILHTDGAATGAELVRCLTAQVTATENIRLFDHCFALDLLTPGSNHNRAKSNSNRRVLGAITHHPRYGLQIIWAQATILAAGGAGQIYRETTNPKVATGDSLAMAYRAGALVGDVEFMQFHPTTLYIAGASRALISEAVRGEGGRLVDRQGNRFMDEYHEMGDLAPRDIVSRAIADQLARTGEAAVFLDVRSMGGDFARRFPNLDAAVRAFDLDPSCDLIPVHPSAHYTIGGVWTDLDGRTSLEGLLACGEAACHGLHGANRLASNSLLEGLVFGRRAGLVTSEISVETRTPVQIVSEIHLDEHGELDLVDVRSSLRSAMWRNVGIERSGLRLKDVVDMCDFWARYTLDNIFDDLLGWETQNMLTVAALVTRASLWRRETRGVHYRIDYPEYDESLAGHALWRIGDNEPIFKPVGQEQESATLSV